LAGAAHSAAEATPTTATALLLLVGLNCADEFACRDGFRAIVAFGQSLQRWHRDWPQRHNSSASAVANQIVRVIHLANERCQPRVNSGIRFRLSRLRSRVIRLVAFTAFVAFFAAFFFLFAFLVFVPFARLAFAKRRLVAVAFGHHDCCARESQNERSGG
jgi:hypothetical protein